jgi:hypothetical protein
MLYFTILFVHHVIVFVHHVTVYPIWAPCYSLPYLGIMFQFTLFGHHEVMLRGSGEAGSYVHSCVCVCVCACVCVCVCVCTFFITQMVGRGQKQGEGCAATRCALSNV